MFRKPVSQEEIQELNLTPFLDVMITLIPFLMLSVSFTAVVVVKAALPSPVREPAGVQIPPPFDLVAQVSTDSIRLYLDHRLPGDAPVLAMSTPGSDAYTDAQLDVFHKKLTEIKAQHPQETRMAVDPQGALPLERLTQIMDQSRTLRAGEQVAGVQGDGLFPQVALKGVYVP